MDRMEEAEKELRAKRLKTNGGMEVWPSLVPNSSET